MSVQARINYVDKRAPDPTTWYVTPPEGVPVCSVVDDPREVAIADARDVDRRFTIEEDGFSFIKLPTDFREHDDPDAVRAKLYPQMKAITAELLGREVAAVFDHAVRRRPKPDATLRGGGMIRQPLHRVHCDFTPASARQQLVRSLGDDARDWLDRPFAMVNFWRPISGPLRDDPLAICAPQSVAPDDLVRVRHVHGYGDSEVYGVAHNPDHRWYYMSDMGPEDAIFFKVYDEGSSDVRVAPHTAFTLPAPPQPVPTRESFELRLMAFYD